MPLQTIGRCHQRVSNWSRIGPCMDGMCDIDSVNVLAFSCHCLHPQAAWAQRLRENSFYRPSLRIRVHFGPFSRSLFTREEFWQTRRKGNRMTNKKHGAGESAVLGPHLSRCCVGERQLPARNLRRGTREGHAGGKANWAMRATQTNRSVSWMLKETRSSPACQPQTHGWKEDRREKKKEAKGALSSA